MIEHLFMCFKVRVCFGLCWFMLVYVQMDTHDQTPIYVF
jgi:hypothetical protein